MRNSASFANFEVGAFARRDLQPLFAEVARLDAFKIQNPKSSEQSDLRSHPPLPLPRSTLFEFQDQVGPSMDRKVASRPLQTRW